MDKKLFMDRVFESTKYELTSGYGYRISPITGIRKWHDGEDYGVFRVPGRPLYSPVFGTVIVSAYSAIMGHYVKIKTPYGTVRMQHMKYRAVSVGQKVCPGTLVGVCASTGSSTGIHLHIAYYSLLGKTMDPKGFIAAYGEFHAYPGQYPTANVYLDHGTYENIRRWQLFLNWYGLETTVDGNFGPHTQKQTKEFQRLRHMKLIDGIVGPATRLEAKEARR